MYKRQYLSLSIRLQQEFGLRREESLKFIPSYAIKRNHVELKGSWTKGGIPRTIPILTAAQKALIQELQASIPANQSLIPEHKSFKQQENFYKKALRNAGFKNLHGLRHAYTQKRYQDLVNHETKGCGWLCPKQGGKGQQGMSIEERRIDEHARALISNELGHSRVEITKAYLG